MTPKSAWLSDELHAYLLAHTSPLDEVQRSLIEETARLGGVARMQVAPEQGALLTILTRLAGTRFAIEVGTFTGYSALCIARGLAEGGRLLCCDVSEEWTAIGRRYWAAAGVEDRIDLRLAPAGDTLAALPGDASVDLAFIDADKGGYIDYWEALVPRLRPAGIIVVDNVLWSGRVIDPGANEADTEAIRRFNDHVAADARVEIVMLPVADGLTIAQRR